MFAGVCSAPNSAALEYCGQLTTFCQVILFHIQNIWLHTAKYGKLWPILATDMVALRASMVQNKPSDFDLCVLACLCGQTRTTKSISKNKIG